MLTWPAALILTGAARVTLPLINASAVREALPVAVRIEFALDPAVVTMKQTLYRTSEDSPMVRALTDAGATREAVVVVELGVISWIRWKYMDTPPLSATFQVAVGGALVFACGILIGSS